MGNRRIYRAQARLNLSHSSCPMDSSMTDTNASPATRKSAVDGFIAADADNISLFPEQVVDNMMHVLIDLGAEIWTIRRRMMILERVLEKAGISSEDVERYVPAAADKALWAKERDIFVARAFGAFSRTGGANAHQFDASIDR